MTARILKRNLSQFKLFYEEVKFKLPRRSYSVANDWTSLTRFLYNGLVYFGRIYVRILDPRSLWTRLSTRLKQGVEYFKKWFKDARIKVPSTSIKSQLLKGKAFFVRNRPPHIKVEFKITITRLVIIGLLIANFYPHSHKTIASPEPIRKAPVSNAAPLSSHDLPILSPIPVKVVAPPMLAPSVVDCGSDPNMAFIYSHESGCRTDALNPNGACGLGQAYPCSKMGCSLSDWDCQNAFFTAYTISRYGSTYNGMQFWLTHHWY